MVDRLDTIFERQKLFQTVLNQDLGKLLKGDELLSSEKELQRLTKDTVLQLFSEIHEVLSEVNWKGHKRAFPIDKEKIREEIIDVFHFVVNLCLIWDMDANKLYDEFMKKNAKNFERFIK